MRIKIKKNSIIFKLFIVIFILLISMAFIISLWSVRDVNNIVKDEMKIMNKKVMDQISKRISIISSNLSGSLKKISIDNNVISILANKKGDLSKEENLRANTFVQGLLMEETFSNLRFNIKPEIYVIGKNEMVFSTYSKTDYKLEHIQNEIWYKELLDGKKTEFIIDTYKNEKGIGPYKHIFKIGQPIRDLISGEFLGVVVMDVSEKMLYDSYADSEELGENTYILSKDKKIISSKDKREIGRDYTYKSDSIVKKDGEKFMILTSNIKGYGWSIVNEIPLESLSYATVKITNRLIILVLVLILISIFISYRMSLKLSEPILKIKERLNRFKLGDKNVKIKVTRNDEIGELEEAFNLMTANINFYVDKIKKEEEEKRLAELSFLQAQINPHFLYNTLSSIRFLISMNKNEEAEEMVFRFTKLLRGLLHRASEEIPLEEELYNISNYVKLQELRYPDKFKYEYSLEKGLEDIKVPFFIFQPIIENAIIYSMEKEENIGEIILNAYEDEEDLVVVIKDNGIGMSKEKIDTVLDKGVSVNRVGVINVNERIKLRYGDKYGVQIRSKVLEGTKVVLRLPRKRG